MSRPQAKEVTDAHLENVEVRKVRDSGGRNEEAGSLVVVPHTIHVLWLYMIV